MFLGADTEELQEAGQKCQEGAEATGQVIQYLRALVLALKAASFFTGGASAAYAQYLETTVIPWLERVKQALDLFARVLLAHADAQNRVSAGESVDWSGLPTYRTPALPAGDTRDYPPLVSGTPGPVTAGPGAQPVTGPAPTTPGSGDLDCFGPMDQVAREAGVPLVFWFWGGVDKKAFADAMAAGTADRDIPTNHSPFYAPVLQPTLDNGVQNLVVAAREWLAERAS